MKRAESNFSELVHKAAVILKALLTGQGGVISTKALSVSCGNISFGN